jgi:NTP pyrophosphatase (non-canonical NTP hydrolase)
MLTFEVLGEINQKRCEVAFPECNDWLIVDWSNAVCGEAGEMANVVKKIRRGDFLLDDPEHKRKLAYEMADAVIYLSLMAQRIGVDLPEAIVEKFNLVSDFRKVAIKLEKDENGVYRGVIRI